MNMEAQSLSMSIDKSELKFTKYDFGWVLLCIGMAIGGGIVFLPVQVGLKGVWVFLASLVLAYPALYMLQELYLKTLSKSPKCDDYTGVITHYLGKNWSFILSILYFLMLLKGMLTYSLAVTFDSAAYLHSYGISDNNLSQNSWYALAILAGLVAIAAQGERLLFKVSGPLVLMKLFMLIFMGIAMIPSWSINNIGDFPEIKNFIADTILTLPFTLFSILFVQILSPMNIAYRNRESNSLVATYKAIRVNRIAYTVLAIIVVFFALSFTFTLSYEQAQDAAAQNISALAIAIASQVIPGKVIAIFSILLNVFAIISSFFGIYLGLNEAVKGLVLNVFERFISRTKIPENLVSFGAAALIILGLWFWVMTKFSILLLQQLGAPIYGVVACLIPCYLVYKVPALKDYRDWKIYYISAFGVLLCSAPLLKLIGQ